MLSATISPLQGFLILGTWPLISAWTWDYSKAKSQEESSVQSSKIKLSI